MIRIFLCILTVLAYTVFSFADDEFDIFLKQRQQRYQIEEFNPSWQKCSSHKECVAVINRNTCCFEVIGINQKSLDIYYNYEISQRILADYEYVSKPLPYCKICLQNDDLTKYTPLCIAKACSVKQ